MGGIVWTLYLDEKLLQVSRLMKDIGVLEFIYIHFSQEERPKSQHGGAPAPMMDMAIAQGAGPKFVLAQTCSA